jgi:hypothetical protein
MKRGSSVLIVQRLKELFERYGGVAVGTYAAIFLLVFVGFAVAIAAGFEVESASGSAGILGAAYVATKLTQPLRIVGTLLLTRAVASGLEKVGWRKKEVPPPSDH